MNFHTFQFAVFLFVVFGVFWTVARSRGKRNAVLLIASYVFYGAYGSWLLTLIVFSTFLDWWCGNKMYASDDKRVRRRFLWLSLLGNLGVLSFFKYYDWAANGFALVSTQLGHPMVHQALISAVPVGISFYTFQTLSYTIDIYRGKMKPARSFLDFSLFVAFFPQLVAGPIVRAADFLPQLEIQPYLDRERLHRGLYRIALGLSKKVLIADVLGAALVDPVFNDPGQYDGWTHLLALYGFAFQIYGDFSGYSDIAIGAAILFGIKLPENFKLPFQSRSMREFWRRWHITLGYWLRDYVFFPLGGSKGKEPRVWFNLLATMVLVGVWHGAHGRWVLYGLFNGLLMCFERMFERMRGGTEFTTTKFRSVVAWFLTFHAVSLSIICVRAKDWDEFNGVAFDYGDGRITSFEALGTLAIALLLHLIPYRYYKRAQERICALPTEVGALLFGAVIGLVAYKVVGATPYIYFQF